MNNASDTPPATHFVCNLSFGHAFYPDSNTPPVPVLAAFAGGPLHKCQMEGSWDLKRATLDKSDRIIRSYRNILHSSSPGRWEDLLFQLSSQSFLYVDRRRVIGYASTHTEADIIARDFVKNYSREANSGGSFRLIRSDEHEVDSEVVTLSPEAVLNEQTFLLHYGKEFLEWHKTFIETLSQTHHGLSIFEGQPGTGKTSYLRHLIGSLKESHRFYFIPPSSLDVLSQAKFIGFWAEERHTHEDSQFVVVLEDAEAALMTRGFDNRDQVSAILNLSDGLLADFLRLQIICTINCSSNEIDPALLRSGRLRSHRLFNRLEYVDACRLAKSLGKQLPAAKDFSLAEIFAGTKNEQITRPRIGFSV